MRDGTHDSRNPRHLLRHPIRGFMAITEKQRQDRKNHIGSSDVAAILKMDPFKSAYDIWLEKTGKLEDKEKTGHALSLGVYLEHAILKMAEKNLGRLVRDPKRLEFPIKEFPVLVAHPDAIVKLSVEPVEGKSTNLTYRAPSTDEWGEEGTDQVPERVIIQCTVQCMGTGAEVCHNPVIIGGRGFVMFRIPFDKSLAQMILDRMGEFWDKNVRQDIPPEDSVPSMEIIRRVRREPMTVSQIDDNLVASWVAMRESRLSLQKAEEEEQAKVLAKIGTAEAGQFSGGLVTFYEQTRKAYSVPESKFRVMRLSKQKGLPK